MAEAEQQIGLDELMMRSEKLEGKLSAVDDAKARTDERLMRLAEELGEMRSMILERERAFSEIETDFERIKDVFDDIKPSKLRKELDAKEREIVENRVKIEKYERLVESLSKEIAEFREMMTNIKGLENLAEFSRDVQDRVKKVDDAKRYTDRLASKVEKIFGELSRSLLEVEEQKRTLEVVDELTRELVRSVDELQLKLPNFLEDKDLLELRNIIKTEDLGEIKRSLVETISEVSASKDVEGSVSELMQTAKSLEEGIGKLKVHVEAVSPDEIDRRMQELDTKVEDLRRGVSSVSSKLEKRSLEGLNKEKERVLTFLSAIKAQYEEGLISKEGYEEALRGNVQRLSEINSEIDELKKTDMVLRKLQDQEVALEAINEQLDSLASTEELKQLRERIVQDDLSELRTYLERKVHDISIPDELRNEIQNEISKEVKITMEEGMGKVIPQLRSRLDDQREIIEGLEGLSKELVRKEDLEELREYIRQEDLEGLWENIRGLEEQVGLVTGLEKKIDEQTLLSQKIIDLCGTFVGANDLEALRNSIRRREVAEIRTLADGRLETLSDELGARLGDQEFAVKQLLDLYDEFIGTIKGDIEGLKKQRAASSERMEGIYKELSGKIHEQRHAIRALTGHYDDIVGQREFEAFKVSLEDKIEGVPRDIGTKLNSHRTAIKKLSGDLKTVREVMDTLEPEKVRISVESLGWKLGELERHQTQMYHKVEEDLDATKEVIHTPLREMRGDIAELDERLRLIPKELDPKLERQKVAIRRLTDLYDGLVSEDLEALKTNLGRKIDDVYKETTPQIRGLKQTLQKLTDLYYHLAEDEKELRKVMAGDIQGLSRVDASMIDKMAQVERILKRMDESGYLPVVSGREVSKPVYRPPTRPPVRERRVDAEKAVQEIRKEMEALEQPVDIPTKTMEKAQELRKEMEALERPVDISTKQMKEIEEIREEVEALARKGKAVVEPMHEPETIPKVMPGKPMYRGLSLEELLEKQDRVITMRDMLKRQYRNGRIPQETYEETLKASIKRLMMIDKEIKRLEKEVLSEAQPAQ